MHPNLYSALGSVWAMDPRVLRAMTAGITGGLEADVRKWMASADPARVAARAKLAGRVQANMGGDWFDPATDPHIRPSGVGVLPIRGPQLDRGAWCYQGYDQHRAALKEFARAKIKALAMPIDSPGGQASGGLVDLCDDLRTFRESIPVYSVADCSVGSAAEVIASQATLSFTGVGRDRGHLGTWIQHVDYSMSLTDMGIAPKYYYRGAYKVFFAGDIPRTAQADEVFEGMVESAYNLLLDMVAAGRGARLTREQVAAQDARIYHGAEAIGAGLADGMATLEELLAELEGRS